MQIYNIIAGVILLMFGRKLFWLFLGIAGFFWGMEITPIFFGDQPQWVQLSIAIGMGCLGAIVSILTQRLAFAFGGFFTCAYLALRLASSFAMDENGTTVFMVLCAGIIGAVIATLIMDKAITFFACLVGAGAIVGEFNLGYSMTTFVFVILTGTGFLFQEKLLPVAEKNV